MSAPARVAVVLTSFNHARFLPQAIDSVLNQTFQDFELIIWDDGSTDESWEIIRGCGDPRIRAFRNEDSQSGWGFRKAVLQVRSGEYIAIHHSDDVWEPPKLEKQVAFMDQNPEYGAVFSNAMTIGDDGAPYRNPLHAYYNIFDQPNRSRHEWLRRFFYQGNALCHPSVLIRRSAFDAAGGYRFGFAQTGDMDLWVRLCLKHELHVLPERLVRFRYRPSRLNASANRRDVRVRAQFELLQIYRNYTGITRADDFRKVFPESAQYADPDGADLGFALAMAALEAPRDKVAKLFALELLFAALNDPERAARIKLLYGFDHADFVRLSARLDVFAVDLAAELKSRFLLRAAAFLRQVDSVVAPRGSRRRRLLNALSPRRRDDARH